MKRVTFGAVIAGAMFCGQYAHAQDGTCYLLAEPRIHPPTITEQEECIECNWTQRVATPHCCAPGCLLFQECSIIRDVYQEGWEELYECDYTPEEFFDAYLGALVAPENLDPGPLWAFVDILAAAYGEPLPGDMQALLSAIGASPLTGGLNFVGPRTLANVLVARQGDLPVENLGDPHADGASFGEFITLANDKYDLIFSTPAPTLEEIACEWEGNSSESPYHDAFQTLVHELVHTAQFEDDGGTAYAARGLYGLSTNSIGPLEEGVQQWLRIFWQNIRDRVACPGSTEEPLTIGTASDFESSTNSMGGLALYASDFLKINDRARIRTSLYELCQYDYAGIFECYASVGSGGFAYIGTDALVGSVIGPSGLEARDRSAIFGSTLAPWAIFGVDVMLAGLSFEIPDLHLESNLEYFEPELPYALETLPYIPPNTGPHPIAPGSYHELIVNSGSQVALSSGTYFFNRLVLESGSQLVVAGTEPVRVFVIWDLIYRGDMVADPEHVLVGYLGPASTTLGGYFGGTLVAPKAHVEVQSRNVSSSTPSHHGALYANSIEIHQNTNWHHAAFKHAWLP